MPNTSPRERQKSARKSSSVKIEKIDEKKAKDDKKDQKLDVSVCYLSILTLSYFYPCLFSQLLWASWRFESKKGYINHIVCSC